MIQRRGQPNRVEAVTFLLARLIAGTGFCFPPAKSNLFMRIGTNA